MRSGDNDMTLGLWLVVIAKGITAVLLWGAFILLMLAERREPTDFFSQLVRDLFRGNPPGIAIRFVVSQTAFLTHEVLTRLAIATVLYATLESIEAIGLALRKTWAEWLTVLVTASLLPFEIYELIKEPTPVKGATLLINLAVLVYLLKRLRDTRTKHHRGKQRPAPSEQRRPATA